MGGEESGKGLRQDRGKGSVGEGGQEREDVEMTKVFRGDLMALMTVLE